MQQETLRQMIREAGRRAASCPEKHTCDIVLYEGATLYVAPPAYLRGNPVGYTFSDRTTVACVRPAAATDLREEIRTLHGALAELRKLGRHLGNVVAHRAESA